MVPISHGDQVIYGILADYLRSLELPVLPAYSVGILNARLCRIAFYGLYECLYLLLSAFVVSVTDKRSDKRHDRQI